MERVVVITGASSGIGAALAVLLASKGHKLVLAARRKKELDDVASRAGGALAVVCDVTHRSEVQSLAKAAIDAFGHIDAWVNNAGKGITRMPSELGDEDIDEMMTVNVKSALYGMQAVLPHFKERKSGHILNVSSMLGRVPYVPFRAAYNMAKHALNALTASLRVELRDEYPNIHVSTVLPGPVATDFGNNARHGGMDSRAMPGAQSAEEVAEAIAAVLETPRADVYTFPGHAEQAARYYQDIESAEANFPRIGPPRAPAT